MNTKELKDREAYFYETPWGKFATFKKWFIRKTYWEILEDCWVDIKKVKEITT